MSRTHFRRSITAAALAVIMVFAFAVSALAPKAAAAGTFTQGASIELSADGPLRDPYIAYFQGGLTYESGKYGIMTAAQEVIDL